MTAHGRRSQKQLTQCLCLRESRSCACKTRPSADGEQNLCLLCTRPESSELTSAAAQVDDRTAATSPRPRGRVTLRGARPPGDNHPAGRRQVLTRPAVAESLALLHGAHGNSSSTKHGLMQR